MFWNNLNSCTRPLPDYHFPSYLLCRNTNEFGEATDHTANGSDLDDSFAAGNRSFIIAVLICVSSFYYVHIDHLAR